MNSFGRIFRVSIYGESHGRAVGILIDGCPAGINLSESDFHYDLKRRNSGAKGTTRRKDGDKPQIFSGIFDGKTSGSPILINFENDDAKSEAYSEIRFTPRPGHADLTAFNKYGGYNDYRGGGHFSGRLTVGIVAAGVIAKKIIPTVEINAKVIEVGASDDIEGAVKAAIAERDSIGGIVECRASNLPFGLGEPFFDSFESVLSHLIFSIPAIKGIEFGSGFHAARMKGSEHNDNIISLDGITETNNSGGISGGISNNNEIVFRVAVKPTSSISKKQKTIDLRSGKSVDIQVKGRHDTCIALRIPVIIEAALAIVIADFALIDEALFPV